MGFFDKLKASVGIGGATVELQAPPWVHAESKVTVMVAVKGGKLEQVVNAVDLSLSGSRSVEEKDPQTGNMRTVSKSYDVWTRRVESAGAKVAPGGLKSFEVGLDLPVLHDAIELSAIDFWEITEDAEDPARLAGDLDEPLASVGTYPVLTLRASADIPGAVDPSATREVLILPPAAGPMKAAGRTDDVLGRLDAVGARRVFALLQGEQWFAFFTGNDARVVAVANLKAIASVRPEGVVRTYTNTQVPTTSVLNKQAGEGDAVRPGGFPEARAWAKELAASSSEVDGVLERPIGNAFFGLAGLRTI